MHCPVCERELETVAVRGIDIDLCREGCRGMWFDGGELNKFDQRHEAAGTLLLGAGRPLRPTPAHGPIHCPRCDEVTLQRDTIGARIVIDVCPHCAGVWLDGHELAELRGQSQTPTAHARCGCTGHCGGCERHGAAPHTRRMTHLLHFLQAHDAASLAVD